MWGCHLGSESHLEANLQRADILRSYRRDTPYDIVGQIHEIDVSGPVMLDKPPAECTNRFETDV